MTNKKKVKGPKAAKAIGQDEPVVDSTPAAPSTRGLTQPQLTGVIFLAMASSYVLEFYRAYNAGIESKACGSYYVGADACTIADAAVIQAKFYSSVVSTATATFAMLLCWDNEPLFHTLIAFLCISPVGLTYIALYCARSAVIYSRLKKLVMSVSVVLAVGSSSVHPSKFAKIAGGRFSSLQHVCLVSFFLLNSWEAIGLLKDGVEGYFSVDRDDISDGTTGLLSFVALDKFTSAVIAVFAVVFFDQVKKRSMLFFLALIRFGELLQFPKLEVNLTDAPGVHNMLIGSAVFAVIGAFTPSFRPKA